MRYRARGGAGRTRAIVVGALAAVGVAGIATAQADAATYMQADYKTMRVKPKTVTFGAAGELEGLRWRTWGGRVATAKRVRYSNNGYSGRNTVRVSRRIRCRGHRVYSRLTIVGKGSPGPITLTCRQLQDVRFARR